MSDRNNEKPIIVQTTSGSGGWATAILTAVILAGVAFYLVTGGKMPGSDTVNVNIEAPKVEAPAAPETPAAKEVPAAPAAPATNP